MDVKDNKKPLRLPDKKTNCFADEIMQKYSKKGDLPATSTF